MKFERHSGGSLVRLICNKARPKDDIELSSLANHQPTTANTTQTIRAGQY